MLIAVLLAIQPVEILAKLEAKYSRIGSLSMTVTHTIEKPVERSERWRYIFRSPDKFRIEMSRPEKRILVSNGTRLWEYLPAGNAAMLTDLGKLDAAERTRTLNATLGRVSVKGLSLPHGTLQAPRLLAEKDGTVEVEATVREKKQTLRATIDAARLLLLKTELMDQGGNVLTTTEAFDPEEVSRDFWIVRRIRVRTMLAPVVEERYILADVEVNQDVEAEKFEFTPPESARVERR